jgi:hypothetical protein
MVQSKWNNFAQIVVIVILYYIDFVNGSLALASSESSLSDVYVNFRELAGLAEKWNLTSNGVEFDALNFQLNYIVSDFIIDSMMEAVAYATRECRDEGIIVPEDDMDFIIISDDTPAGSGDFERAISVNVTVNPTNLEDSSIYKIVYDEDGKRSAEVEFCMRFSLYTNGDTPIEVNFLETIVGFKADLSAGFSIDAIAVAPKEVLVTTVTQDYEVDAYQCDDGNQALSATALAEAMKQGEVIRVCVTPNQEARDDGIYMRAIESFTYVRDYEGPVGIVTQIAIENSQAASNFLTELYCTAGSLVCAFETVLFSSMFLTPGYVDGSGTALLQFGDSPSRRRLKSQLPYRSLQGGDDAVAAVSPFDLAFDLVLGEKFNGKIRTSSASKESVMFPVVAMGTMMILNALLF